MKSGFLFKSMRDAPSQLDLIRMVVVHVWKFTWNLKITQSKMIINHHLPNLHDVGFNMLIFQRVGRYSIHPQESWDLKTGGLEIPEPCEKQSHSPLYKRVQWFLRIHLGRLTWNLKITHFERNMIFQTSMVMFHVNLPGCRTFANSWNVTAWCLFRFRRMQFWCTALVVSSVAGAQHCFDLWFMVVI